VLILTSCANVNKLIKINSSKYSDIIGGVGHRFGWVTGLEDAV